MSRFYLENLSQSLKYQTTGKEQNRYHLGEIGTAGESTIRLKPAVVQKIVPTLLNITKILRTLFLVKGSQELLIFRRQIES